MFSDLLNSYEQSIELLKTRIRELNVLMKHSGTYTSLENYNLKTRRQLLYTEARELKETIRLMKAYSFTLHKLDAKIDE